MVPEDKPAQALQMLYNWMNDVDLSTNVTTSAVPPSKEQFVLQ